MIDVGCGRLKYPRAVGLDYRESAHADVIHDLDSLPYPFPDHAFDVVIARHVLEHVRSPLEVVGELARITKAGGAIHIVTPHFSSVTSWTDPTHLHHFSSRSFDYLVEGTDYSFYTTNRIVVTQRRVTLGLLPLPRGRVLPLLRMLGIEWLVNRYLDAYERWWAFCLPLGPRDLVLRLQVLAHHAE